MCNSFCRKTIMLPREYCATVLYHHKWPPKLVFFQALFSLYDTICDGRVFSTQLFDGFHGLNNQMVLIRGGRETTFQNLDYYSLSFVWLGKIVCVPFISHQFKPNKSGNFSFVQGDCICVILVAFLKSRNTHSIDMLFWGSAALLFQ